MPWKLAKTFFTLESQLFNVTSTSLEIPLLVIPEIRDSFIQPRYHNISQTSRLQIKEKKDPTVPP